MCTVSNVMDGFNDKWQPLRDQIFPQGIRITPQPEVTRAEFDALKAELLELRTLIAKAKAHDEATGQPDCESEDKIKKLRALAEIVGLNVDDLIGRPQKKNPSTPPRRAK
jgi:hypothetical protein